MYSKIRLFSFFIASFLLFSQAQIPAAAEDDILDFLPAILANAKKIPPPPARWQITNRVSCISGRSIWTVTDGVDTRSSSVTSIIIESSNTSRVAQVEPGNRTFEWRLVTEDRFFTCGNLSNSFTRNLQPGFRYNFTLRPNGFGGVRIDTTETRFR